MGDSDLPRGWYDRADGGKQFWDGHTWLTPSTPADEARVPPSRRRTAVIIALAVLLIAGVAGGYALISRDREQAAAVTAARATASAEASARAEDVRRRAEADRKAVADQARKEAAEKARNAAQDSSMEQLGQGWEVVTSGELYLRFASPEEATCGMWNCAGVLVHTTSGCPGGVYVEAAIEQNGTVIGSTNIRIGALNPGQTGGDILQDTANSGGTFRISDVSCYP